MKIREISHKVREIRSEYKTIYTNINWSNLDLDEDVEVFCDKKSIVFIVPETNKNRVYYAVADLNDLVQLLSRIPDGAVLEYFYKNENDMNDLFERAGFAHYANYFRVTTVYKENPYGNETGKRKLLNDLYDPECGEYPRIEDAEELEQLSRRMFDPLTDDVFSIDEWKEIIRKRECLIIKEDDRIITYYVWRVTGKKLYGNMALNLGPANYMYNLERRVFDHMWENGIRVSYAWFNEENNRVLAKTQLSKNTGELYDAIYIKR
ncbi:MAG: hypothetical protein NC489_19245 [Ruminococcus flavefaciens]|nr:hypothetical protein [Ruminococcus flavefaciens]